MPAGSEHPNLTAQFRRGMYALLKDTLGPDWDGPDEEESVRNP